MGNEVMTKDGYVNQFKMALGDAGIKKQFQAVLKDKAPGFMVSLMNFYVDNATSNKAFEPQSVIKSALTAAALDLPIEKSLGYAYLIPYEFKGSGLNQVNFQMGYKGYIQLAQRTGKYRKLTATPIYNEQMISWNPLTEDLQVDFSVDVDYEQEPYGYAFYFELLNGFTKTIFKTRKQVDAHAKRYSSSYKAFLDKKVRSSIWNDNFDAMALKTVVKEGISKWGVMSIEMIEAIKNDEDDENPIKKVKKEIEKAREDAEIIDIPDAELKDDISEEAWEQVANEVTNDPGF